MDQLCKFFTSYKLLTYKLVVVVDRNFVVYDIIYIKCLVYLQQ